jgi:threonyl-tRNA synthetase
MKDRYLVVLPNKDVVSLEDFRKLDNISDQSLSFVNAEIDGVDEEVRENNSNNIGDYIDIANKLGFSWEENSEIGFVNYNHKADLMMRLVKEYARDLVHNIGFPVYEMRGANGFDLNYPVVQEYASLYGDRLFQIKSREKSLVMGYDCSYPQFNLASSQKIYKKDLPFGHFSISDCYRNEQSGECMLLYRQKRFFMPDIHPYFASVEEAFDWFKPIKCKIVNSAKDCGIDYNVMVEVASEEMWSKYKDMILESVSDEDGLVLIQIINDEKPRYWIINVDFKIVDKLGKSREIGCIQIDIGNAKRLGIEYIDSDGHIQNPVIIHSAIPGGVERFIYMLIDKYDSSFPLWLHPIQVRLVPVNDSYNEFCINLAKELQGVRLRVDVDGRSDNVSKKIKRANEELIPNILVIGEKEVRGEGNVSIIESLKNEMNGRYSHIPFLVNRWPII